jgi:hypothetical protein
MRRIVSVLLAWMLLPAVAPVVAAGPNKIEFNRDIRPILSSNCFFCHGPDPKHREADLRLDERVAATAEVDGRRAVAPGKPEASELIARITSTDADTVMPPRDSNKKLTPEQIELLRRWIAEGAEYQTHWAYAPLKKPAAPRATDADAPRVRNDVDRFLLDRLRREKLTFAAEADPRTLLRRLSFDLTGLPPSAEEVEAFARAYSLTPSVPHSQVIESGSDRVTELSEHAYEAAVDRLLASPHFGERMAAWWLDLVRYADTVGYHGDQNVTVWPYRDYVIGAFNANLPFDRFTIEQLAGDLLPEPTREQRVAAGYNRLGMMTAEGGAQDKEYLAKYAADRVRNASTVWMASTMGCAECHDHKFDPFTTRDFYSFASFFADIKEKGFYGGASSSGEFGPRLLLSTPEQDAELKRFDGEIAVVQKQLDAETSNVRKQFDAWVKESSPDEEQEPKKLPADVQKILRTAVKERTKAQNERLFNDYLEREHPQYAEKTKRLSKLQEQRKQLEKLIPSMLVVEQVPPRTMRVLARGNWMDESGEVVAPAVPAFLPQPPARDRLTRLDLARWLVHDDNPLPARVFANRLWAMFFGVGLSKRLDDFGAQGEPPVHAELLDYVAASLRDGWDLKRTIKLLVMSAAYRQASTVDAAVVERDPYNRLYARQSRFRLPAESVRDAALSASDLLVPTVGGRSVRPYQPAGYYAQLNYPKREYQPDTGDNLWRRSLYTHWQRTFLHPALMAFDAPSREECTCDRVRSNTPLQSLVLLNDPEFVEAARVLAERALQPNLPSPRAGEGPGVRGNDVATKTNVAPPQNPSPLTPLPQGERGTAETVARLFRFALQRAPTAEESALLTELYTKHREQYAADKAAAEKLIKIGARPANTELDVVELAATTSVARTILNLHEFVTRD